VTAQIAGGCCIVSLALSLAACSATVTKIPSSQQSAAPAPSIAPRVLMVHRVDAHSELPAGSTLSNGIAVIGDRAYFFPESTRLFRDRGGHLVVAAYASTFVFRAGVRARYLRRNGEIAVSSLRLMTVEHRRPGTSNANASAVCPDCIALEVSADQSSSSPPPWRPWPP
jgi:hypothetical protein